MRKWYAALMMVLTSSAAMCTSASAQEITSDVIFSKNRQFNIPFDLGTRAANIRQLQLFYSTDAGKTWRASGVVAPSRKLFPFICERDGLHWFVVQTLDRKGMRFPASLRGIKPSLKVLVDTLAPTVHIKPLPVGGGRVGVTWQIREEHLDFGDPGSIRLDYREATNKRWIPLAVNRIGASYSWDPESTAPLQVRIRVQDRAGNLTEATTTLNSKGRGARVKPFVKDPPSNTGRQPLEPKSKKFTPDAPRRIINSKDISLNCAVRDLGPSGVSELELWYTTDGRDWNRFPLPKSAVRELAKKDEIVEPKTPKLLKKSIEFSVDREGVFGFTILAKSGVGRSRRPPQIGEAPQIWVEVDETLPVVSIQSVKVHQGIEKRKGKLAIAWTAGDKNLGKTPIRISYAEKSEGPWLPIVTDVANTGRYIWNMGNVPYQFFVRVEARDSAGNVGEDTTREMVKVDLSEPKVSILKVAPAGGGS